MLIAVEKVLKLNRHVFGSESATVAIAHYLWQKVVARNDGETAVIAVVEHIVWLLSVQVREEPWGCLAILDSLLVNNYSQGFSLSLCNGFRLLESSWSRMADL